MFEQTDTDTERTMLASVIRCHQDLKNNNSVIYKYFLAKFGRSNLLVAAQYSGGVLILWDRCLQLTRIVSVCFCSLYLQ